MRARRPLTIAAELGWNGLSGLGLNFTWHPIPLLAFDAGAGLGFTGPKLGLRARVNFLEGEWSPLFGAGLLYTLGSGRRSVELETQDGSEVATVKYLNSPHLQVVGGVNYTSASSFTFTGMTGYAILLRRNIEYVSGSNDLYRDQKSLLGSGIVLSVAFGHSF